jgi:hypothetical protein
MIAEMERRSFWSARGLGSMLSKRNGYNQKMAQEKPLDLFIVQAWLAAWNESDVFSDASVRHFQSLIIDPLCLYLGLAGSRAA